MPIWVEQIGRVPASEIACSDAIARMVDPGVVQELVSAAIDADPRRDMCRSSICVSVILAVGARRRHGVSECPYGVAARHAMELWLRAGDAELRHIDETTQVLEAMCEFQDTDLLAVALDQFDTPPRTFFELLARACGIRRGDKDDADADAKTKFRASSVKALLGRSQGHVGRVMEYKRMISAAIAGSGEEDVERAVNAAQTLLHCEPFQEIGECMGDAIVQALEVRAWDIACDLIAVLGFALPQEELRRINRATTSASLEAGTKGVACKPLNAFLKLLLARNASNDVGKLRGLMQDTAVLAGASNCMGIIAWWAFNVPDASKVWCMLFEALAAACEQGHDGMARKLIVCMKNIRSSEWGSAARFDEYHPGDVLVAACRSGDAATVRVVLEWDAFNDHVFGTLPYGGGGSAVRYNRLLAPKMREHLREVRRIAAASNSSAVTRLINDHIAGVLTAAEEVMREEVMRVVCEGGGMRV